MYLVIAEKPSVSRAIAEVIGAQEREDGYLQGTDCMVSWCFGHLAEYVSPDAYDEKFNQWRYEDLPIIPKDWKVTVSEDKKDQFYILKRLLNSPEIEYVVNACDAGREGELIFKHVYDLSGSKKPVKRLWISSLEDSAILDGMQHLRSAEEYRHLAEAAVCRSQADWLVGMNATRAYTTKYFKKLTVGRVQTPTLAMLVERAGQISNFQKEKYFNVELDCDGIPAVKPKIFDPDEAEQLRSRCQGSEAIVTAVKETEKKVKAPKLYDLTTLQREANRIYGMTAKQTLDTAQNLYEKKLITYPRTDSQYLTEDMEQTARNVVRQIYEKYQLTGPFDQPEQPDVKKVMNNSKVTDHHAIIPTMELSSCHLDELKSWEEKILFLIAVHTVMAMSKEHVYQETEIEVECQGEIFKAKGKTVLQDGWKLFENCFKNKDRMAIVDPDQEMKEKIPKVTQGQTFYAVAAEKTEHFTSPPKPYSEDTLLAAMETAGNKEFDEDTEKKGLGTPATRAGIIEKLIYSQYATRKGKQILPTEDGKVVVKYTSDSWGKVIAVTGELADTVGVQNPFRYKGYYYDNETGMYYLKSRYYDAEIKRFICADGYFSTGVGKHDCNMFLYCNNNPIMNVDVNGYSFISFVKKSISFVKDIVGAVSKGISISGGSAVAIATSDGPSPVMDFVAAGIVLGFSIYEYYKDKIHDNTQTKILSLPRNKKDVVIYRYGGTNPGNLTPSQKDSDTGLSFSTIPPRMGGKAAVTTINTLNKTGIVYAYQDKLTHVSVVPVGVSIQTWINAGSGSIWTQAVKSVVVKWDGGN